MKKGVSTDKERRGRRYLTYRLLVVLLSLVLVAVCRLFLGLAYVETRANLVYGLLAAYVVFACVSFLLYSRRGLPARFMRWQVVVDFGFQSALVWATGGMLSIFTPLLFVTLVGATSVISLRGSFVLATLATLALTGTMVAHALGVDPALFGQVEWFRGRERPAFIIAYLLASVLGLYAISALGSFLSHGLRRIEGIQSEIVENMAEGLIALERDGRVLMLNREARHLLGLAAAPQPKVKLENLLPGERFVNLRKVLEAEERRRVETTILNLAGEEKHVEVKVASLKGQEGRSRYRIALISDLTLKREVEAAERRIQKLEDLRLMAMGIAHEIRNPMASIRGCVQELSRLSRGDERQRRYMQIVCQESDRLDRVMEGFLHYARSGPPDLVPLDFVPVIDEALVLLRSRPEFGARRLVWDPPPERPRIFGDRNRLVQLLLNLGLNAIDATSPTTGEVRLILRARSSVIPGRGWKEAPVAGVELEFGDNGSGMSKESLEKLFMPFFTTKPSGTGLGMCIVERIVREHMGSLDIQSLPGEGSVIRIWLPALAAATPGGAAQEVRSAAEEKEPGVVVS